MSGKIFWSVKEAANALSVGRSTVYGLINVGALATAKIGGRRLVRIDSVLDYANSLGKAA
jgi:excisionase family DNA binding protein